MNKIKSFLKLFPKSVSQTISHGSFSRQGGISPAPFASLNTSHDVGDALENVNDNRQIIKDTLDLRYLVSSHQIHGKNIFCVTEPISADLDVQGHDALITNIPNIGLIIQQADCQSIMLYDPKKRVIANIHSGWRGSIINIIDQTIDIMKMEYNVSPKTLMAAISPSLGSCCAEFVNYRQELPKKMHIYQNSPNHFDFWAMSRDQLQHAGLKPENIYVAGICTCCNNTYFSYRRQNMTGRMASVIGLRER